MTITIEIKRKEQIEEIIATGAKDLKNHFLPKANIHAYKVKIVHCTKEEQEKMLRGEDFLRYFDEC